MLHAQRKRADTSSDRPGKQMNRNVALPAEKAGHQPAGLSPTSFHLSPTSFYLSPTSFQLSPSFFLSLRLGACGRVPGWLVSHFLSFVSHFFSFVSHFFSLSPRLGACGRVPGRLVSHFLSFVSHFFSFVRLGACGRVPGWLVSHFLSFVSQARCLWSGSRPACLPLPFICLPLLFRVGASGPVPGWLVSHFLSFVSHFFSFVSQAGCRPACLPLPCICLPAFSPSSLLLGFLNSFLRCVRPLCHCWCPPISTAM